MHNCIVTRARAGAQVSLCASDRMGGPINDPCPGTNCAAYRPR